MKVRELLKERNWDTLYEELYLLADEDCRQVILKKKEN